MKTITTLWPILFITLACADVADEVIRFNMDAGGVPGAGGAGSNSGGTGGGGPCTAGAVRCADGYEEVCGGSGLWITTNDRGECTVDPCVEARRRRSYIGCEYWPVDLDNAIEVHREAPVNGRCAQEQYQVRDDIEVCISGDDLLGLCDPGRMCPEGFQCRRTSACILDAQGSPFAIVVSNPSDTENVMVTLQDQAGQSHTQSLSPNELVKLFPGALGFADSSVDRSSQGPRAYRLTSTAPIVAYQFNPLDNVGVFSNDGSLLIPDHALDTIYYALTLPTLNRRTGNPAQAGKNSYNGYMTIVGTAAGSTSVRVTLTAAVEAGPNVGRLGTDRTHDFTLNQGDVLNLEAEGDGDLTGSRVEAIDGATKFAMFVGHEATVLTDGAGGQRLCCADHVEEQLFPASTWGTRFAIARTEPRTDQNRRGTAPDMLRILAQKPNTRVEFDPPVSGSCDTLDVGQFCEVFISQDTTITATLPVLVGHFLLSTDGRQGDPALAFAPPREQFRDAYTFLVPDEYDNQYISVAAGQFDTVLLDGRDISGGLSPIAGNWSGGRIEVQPGQHVLTCPQGCGLLVYGYSNAVSYLFAGGLDLEAITVP